MSTTSTTEPTITVIETPYGTLTIYPGGYSPQIKLVCSEGWAPHRLTWDEREQGVAWVDLRRVEATVVDGGEQ